VGGGAPSLEISDLETSHTIHEEHGAADAFFADAKNVYFRKRADAYRFDLGAATATKVGTLPGAHCLNDDEPLAVSARVREAACPSDSYTRVIGLDAEKGRWVVEDSDKDHYATRLARSTRRRGRARRSMRPRGPRRARSSSCRPMGARSASGCSAKVRA